MRITTRTDKSFLMFLLQHLIRPFGTSLIKPKQQFPAGSPQLKPHSAAKRKCRISERRVEGIYIYDMTSKRATAQQTGSSSDRSNSDGSKQSAQPHRVYYFAGGGWQMPPSPEHWKLCAELCTALPSTTVSIVSYPLAPHSAAPVAYPQLARLYITLLRASAAADERVTVAGDSAGGNLALSLTLHALAAQEGDGGSHAGEVALAPASLLVVSPAVDLAAQDEGRATAAQRRDPLMTIPYINGTARAWSDGWDAADPRLSPLNADLGVLARYGVRVIGVTGSWDVLAPPAEEFAEKCQRAGVEGDWLDWKGQMHCFLLAWVYGLRESKEAKEWILEALRGKG
ncbi:hypothetical protein MBLNU459_g1487t1 [Dothideomycetes sp. NU459]